MNTINKGALLVAALLSHSANAGLIVNSINMEVRDSVGFTYQGDYSAGQFEKQFYSGGEEICSIQLDSIDRAGGRQNCGGPNRNFATLFSIDLEASGNTKIQFGPDWGLGGAFYTDTHTEDFLGNKWWSYNWNSGSVFEVDILAGKETVNFIGWENCCAGANSARFSIDDGESWETLKVNAAVPEPAVITLLGLGFLALGATRLKRK